MVSRLCDDGVQGREGRCVENSSCFQIFLFVPVCILLLGSPAGLIYIDCSLELGSKTSYTDILSARPQSKRKKSPLKLQMDVAAGKYIPFTNW